MASATAPGANLSGNAGPPCWLTTAKRVVRACEGGGYLLDKSL